MKEQTLSATWARMLPRLRRNAQELAEHGWEIKEPPSADTPPHKRGLPIPPELGYSTGTGVPLSGTEMVGTPRQSKGGGRDQ